MGDYAVYITSSVLLVLSVLCWQGMTTYYRHRKAHDLINSTTRNDNV